MEGSVVVCHPSVGLYNLSSSSVQWNKLFQTEPIPRELPLGSSEVRERLAFVIEEVSLMPEAQQESLAI
jgi:hypothetical protein